MDFIPRFFRKLWIFIRREKFRGELAEEMAFHREQTEKEMRGLLFGVDSWDLPTLVAVAATLGLCAFWAAYVPARRAASLDPMEVLRAE